MSASTSHLAADTPGAPHHNTHRAPHGGRRPDYGARPHIRVGLATFPLNKSGLLWGWRLGELVWAAGGLGSCDESAAARGGGRVAGRGVGALTRPERVTPQGGRPGLLHPRTGRMEAQEIVRG